MAQIHSINGNTILYVTHANWLDTFIKPSLDGLTAVSGWRGHVWTSNVMPITEWDIISALEGQIVPIVTTNYTDRNAAYTTYYKAILKSISSSHEGPNMANVSFNFLVKV